MRVRIHRGARETGGRCVKIAASEERLTVDVGCPLEEIISVTKIRAPDGTVVATRSQLRTTDPAVVAWLLERRFPGP